MLLVGMLKHFQQKKEKHRETILIKTPRYVKNYKEKKVIEALSHCFTVFSRSHLYTVQKTQPLKQKNS